MKVIRWHHFVPVVALTVFVAGGCEKTEDTAATAVANQTDDDHGHDDHDHGDHDDHDHGDHDHDHGDHDHDHGDHDHGDHDHDHADETAMEYGAAVGEINEFIDFLSKAGEAEEDELHGKLHDIFSVVDKLDRSAKAAKFDKEIVEKVHEAKENLLDALMAIDEKNHGGKGKTYAEVEDAITSALDVIRAQKP